MSGVKVIAALAGGVLVAVAAVVVVVASTGGETDDRPIPDGPNVVVIMTDDQTLASLATMDGVDRLLADQGTTFTTAMVSFPNCCPSRATYMTGRYAHNHGVTDNRSPWGGAGKLDDGATLPVWLQRAGYETIHVGKYLNEWGADGEIAPPPGWDRWFSLIDPSTYDYYGYAVSEDGERREYGDAAEDYSTDVLAAEAVDQIGEKAGDRPFFLSFTPLSPHVASPERLAGEPGSASSGGQVVRFPTPVAPPRHAGDFVGRGLERDASYDEEDVSDKPGWVQDNTRITQSSKDYIERYEIAELGGVAAVDDAVEAIVAALDEAGELDDTVIVFTSDNGLFHGEHRIVTGKFFLYEPSVRVPLVVRGPGFEAGAEVATPVANVDLTPTILDITGVTAGGPIDGHSLVDVAAAPDEDRAILLENFRRDQPNTSGIRTRRWAYLEHVDGERELYDLRDDPSQLENRHGDAEVATVEADLASALARLRDCAAEGCTVEVPASARVP